MTIVLSELECVFICACVFVCSVYTNNMTFCMCVVEGVVYMQLLKLICVYLHYNSWQHKMHVRHTRQCSTLVVLKILCRGWLSISFKNLALHFCFQSYTLL